MENFRQHVYSTCLNKMLGFTYEQCCELREYGLYKKYEKGLACDEYIEDLRVVVNKRLLVNTPITKAELDNHDYSTYVKHGEEVTDLALGNKDKYTQILLDILVDFQDNYVAKRTYAGTLLDKKVCFVKQNFANLSKESRDFLVVFLKAFLGPIQIYEGYGASERLEKAITQYVLKGKTVQVDVDEIKRKYYSITSQQLDELGLKVYDSDFHTGYDVTADSKREVVIIPAFIDGKNVGKLDTMYVSKGAVHPQTVVILGDVDMVQNFMPYSQNVTKVYALGNIKGMCRYSLNASSDLFTVTEDATYLAVNDNPYYVLKSVKETAPSHFKCNEQTQVIGSRAFSNCNVTSIDFANAKYLSDEALAYCKATQLDFSNFDTLTMKVCLSCPNLKRVVLGNKMSVLRHWPFDCVTTLEELVISNSLKSFFDFEHNIGLKRIVVEKDVTLPICLFEKCKDVQEVVCTEQTFKNYFRPGGFGTPKCDYRFVDISTYKKATTTTVATKTVAKTDNATPSTQTKSTSATTKTTAKVSPSTTTTTADTSKYDTPEARKKDAEFIKLLQEQYDANCYEEADGASLSGPTGIACKKFHAPKWFGDLQISSIWYFFFDEEEEIEYVHFKSDVQLREDVLKDCPNLEYIQSDGDITYVEASALNYVPKLETKYGGVTYIKVNDNPYYIAKECTSKKVTDVVLHPDCVVVRNYAFYENQTVESVDFANVKYIGDNVFNDCPNLKKITINDATVSVGLCDNTDFVFRCNALEQLNFGNGVQKLNCFPLRCCEGIKTLTLPPLVTQLVDDFCQECTNLEEVKFPPNLAEISFTTLAHMPALKTIYVGKDTVVKTQPNGVWDELILSTIGGTEECTKRVSKIKIVRY